MSLVHLLVNPAARKGSGARHVAKIAEQLNQLQIEVAHITPTSPEDVAIQVNAARENGMRRLIIVGGDGIIHHALPAVVNTDVIIGLIPHGSGNDFARALGIPANTSQAVANALAEDVAIDLIRCGNRWAASVVTGGWSGDVNERAIRMRFPRGQQRYTVATLLELGRLKTIDLKLNLNGEVHEQKATLFAIGNTSFFGGGMKVCPDAVANDGKLQVAILEPVSTLELILLIPKIFSGKHIEHPKVKVWSTESVAIETSAALWADGEPFGDGDATLTIAANAIRVAGANLKK